MHYVKTHRGVPLGLKEKYVVDLNKLDELFTNFSKEKCNLQLQEPSIEFEASFEPADEIYFDLHKVKCFMHIPYNKKNSKAIGLLNIKDKIIVFVFR